MGAKQEKQEKPSLKFGRKRVAQVFVLLTHNRLWFLLELCLFFSHRQHLSAWLAEQLWLLLPTANWNCFLFWRQVNLYRGVRRFRCRHSIRSWKPLCVWDIRCCKASARLGCKPVDRVHLEFTARSVSMGTHTDNRIVPELGLWWTNSSSIRRMQHTGPWATWW